MSSSEIMFECDLCEYSTEKNYNWNRHLESQVHIDNVEKKEIRRKNKIKKERKKYREIIEKINQVNTKIEEQGKQINDKIDQQGNKIDKLDNKVSDVKKGVKKLTDCVDFLNEYCSDAKPIEKISEREIEEMLKIKEYKNKKTKFALEELLLWKMKFKQLHEHVGDLIAEHYSESDPKKQGIWSSDTARSTYLIMQNEPVKNKKENKIWIRDKKGVLFTKLITDPLVDKIKNLMNEYAIEKTESLEIEDPNESIVTKFTNAQQAIQLNSKCTSNKLAKNITKHTAGKLCLNKRKPEIENN
jgi:hypothetical protein